MSEPKHTPGPLRVSNYKQWNIYRGGKSDMPVALGHAEKHADAVLWAAAPELLAACKAALGIGNVLVGTSDEAGRQRCMKILKAAIAKAKGQ